MPLRVLSSHLHGESNEIEHALRNPFVFFSVDMARFRYFSCLGSLGRKHGDGTQGVKFVHCVTNARLSESTEIIVAIDMSDPGCVLSEGVYKGFLKDNGQEVAVKRFDEPADFRSEIRMIKGLEHSNLVKMIAYSNRTTDLIVVYEFVPCGSLNLHLRDLQPGKKPLDWKTRMKIAEGVAKALEYLHDQNVIYSGLKSSSILLDENYNPKLSDFGCARPGPKWNYAELHTRLMRGYGYIAPEYAIACALKLESDVFGFGVVLLELISGQKTIEENIRGSGKNTLTTWTKPLLDDSKNFSEIADPIMRGQYPYFGFVKALNLAKMCLKREPHERPPIAEVVITLSKIFSQIDEVQVMTEDVPFTPPTMLRSAQAVA